MLTIFAVIRNCPFTSPTLSWLLGRCDIVWIGDSVEFSHVVRVVKTVRISKVILSRVVTMSPMSLVTHCAETKQTNLGLISKVGLLPQIHYGFSIGLNHLHTDHYFNVLGHVVFMTPNIKCQCQFALIYFSFKMAPLYNCCPTDISVVIFDQNTTGFYAE